jgi:hypothetical protein
MRRGVSHREKECVFASEMSLHHDVAWSGVEILPQLATANVYDITATEDTAGLSHPGSRFISLTSAFMGEGLHDCKVKEFLLHFTSL